MNTVPESLDATPSLRELAKDAERMERRAHRRTLIVTLSIGAAAMLAMSVWTSALILSENKGREQTRIAQTTLAGAFEQIDQIQDLFANGNLPAVSAMNLLATTENTLGNLRNIQNNPQIQQLEAQLLLTLSDVNLDTRNTGDALAQATEAKRIALQLETARNPEASKLVYNAKWRIGDLLSRQKDYAGAAEEYEGALQIAEQSLGKEPGDLGWGTSLSRVLLKIGDNKKNMHQLDAALANYRDALDVANRNAASDPTRMEAPQLLASAHFRLGDLYLDLSKYEEALTEFKEALAIRKNIANKDPSVVHLTRYAATFQRIGNVLSKLSNFMDAIKNYERALDVLQHAAGIDPNDITVQSLLTGVQADLGDVFMRTDQYDKAIEKYRVALQIREQLLTKSPDDVMLKRSVEMYRRKIEQAEAASNEKK
jgi:tetratricopeptide (TPR) repeat protein